METGGVIIKNDVYMHRRYWAITLLLSIAVMVISLVIFCLTGKPNNMEDSIAFGVIVTARVTIALYTSLGAMVMYFDPPLPPKDSPPKISPDQRAAYEVLCVVLLCVVTLMLGKMVEVFFFTMSFIIASIALHQLFHPTIDDHDDDFDMMVNHLSFIISLGIVTGLVCLIPNLFVFLGWFSIFVLTYVYILRFNFPDKTIVEVLAMVSEFLDLK
ncbi:unnamed protein product [Arabis nemorensis]|uniref:Uncharacterized protein n=1 Tax=Arabis nemorensis TaxID=586526 RepID=A0A565BMC0_9BRAS|nr:unnamed protein product [Arabis nemorensis]